MSDGETRSITKLNMISGVVIPPLMEVMCQERDSISPIEVYLWELYEKSEYPTIAPNYLFLPSLTRPVRIQAIQAGIPKKLSASFTAALPASHAGFRRLVKRLARSAA